MPKSNNKSELKDSLGNVLIDLKSQMELVISLNKPLANTKNLALILNYDEVIPIYLISDLVRVQRIILELITNALAFTEQGKVTLTVRLSRSNYHESIIEIAVSDTGIGMLPEKDIFTRFKRLISSCQNVYRGLGLSIIKQFVDDMSGEILVNSQVGEGMTFRCFIPFENPLLIDSADIVELVPIKVNSEV